MNPPAPDAPLPPDGEARLSAAAGGAVRVPAPPAARTCPQCATPAPCYDPAHSTHFGCANCLRFFRAAQPGAPGAVLTGFRQALAPGPWLALGSAGALGGYYLRVTGYQVRAEHDDPAARWAEYQLTPADPAAPRHADLPLQLAEYQGHWLLIRRAQRHPEQVPAANAVWHDAEDENRLYKLWHRYRPTVQEARGEFDWNVLDDQQLHISELVGPPYLLACEKLSRHQAIWYRAEYLTPAEVAAAFNLRADQLPPQVGVGAAQPAPGAATWPAVRRLLGFGVLALLALFTLMVRHPPAAVLEQEFGLANAGAFADSLAARQQRATRAAGLDTLAGNAAGPDTTRAAAARNRAINQLRHPADDARPLANHAAKTTPMPQQVLVSNAFDLAEDRQAVALTLETPGLDNNWVEVIASLVNEQTGRGYEATRSLEYYSGYEGGEHWREGAQTAEAVFGAVPRGRYHLNLYPTAGTDGPAPATLRAKMETNTVLWSNFWVALAAIGLVPVLRWLRRYWFEQERWSQSDFGPKSSS